MSNQLSSVLERLRAFGSERLAEFDAREEEHRGWLRAAVDEVRAQIAALAPATKRQRLDAGGAAQATAAQPEEQVRGGQWLGPGLGIVRCTERPSLASSRPRTALAAAGCRNLPSIHESTNHLLRPLAARGAFSRTQGARQEGRAAAGRGAGGRASGGG